MSVVVSGIGLVTPLGASRELTWRRLLNGETGIRGRENGLEAAVRGVSPNGARSRAGDFAVLAADEAFHQSGLDPANVDVGCAIGQSKPLLCHCEEQSDEAISSMRSPRPLRGLAMTDPSLDPSLLLSSFTGWSLESVVKSHFRLNGPSANVTAACATGVASIETAAAWIRSGACDAALAGAAEASLFPFYRAGFERMGVLAQGDDPRNARPFDRRRTGFAMGEGAAVLVLESEKLCRRRGGVPIARLANAVMRHSSHDPIRFDDGGGDVARLVAAALRGRGAPSYINAHGTGTVMNDAAESRGLRTALGPASGAHVGSTKASTGHLLGAAGAVEAAFAALSVHDGVMPPSLHIEEPDPLCDFWLLRDEARRSDVRSALSLSYGFGGQMGAVLWERI
jgi:3-oxoacyl-[acyl-carrier-protein] synthase II